jgi:DNA-binding transcriptional ArsR family regulator
MAAYSRVAPVEPRAVRRATQNGAELGRRRILELLADGEVRGVEGLAQDAHMSVRTLMQRLKELRDVVDVREQVHGCALVKAR